MLSYEQPPQHFDNLLQVRTAVGSGNARKRGVVESITRCPCVVRCV